VELLIVANPNPDSRLPYLIRLPLGGGLVFATSDVWPRTKALYCHRLDIAEWPHDPVLIDRVELRSCSRRGAAIDVVAARPRENRSQLVHTMARGRQVVFWQSPKTRKQSRPGVRTPTARAAGIRELAIVVDTHERYPYTFTDKPVTTTRAALPCGDYGLQVDGQLVAAVERKALSDLSSGVLSGKLKYQLTELAALARAAVVVEDRYSEVFALTHARPAVVADGLAELQINFPTVPIVFCQTRKLAQEYTYRYLAAAHAWHVDDADAATVFQPPPQPDPNTAELRAWAKSIGLRVSDRGRVPQQILQSWHEAHQRRG
jgi:hypothetical protein